MPNIEKGLYYSSNIYLILQRLYRLLKAMSNSIFSSLSNLRYGMTNVA